MKDKIKYFLADQNNLKTLLKGYTGGMFIGCSKLDSSYVIKLIVDPDCIIEFDKFVTIDGSQVPLIVMRTFNYPKAL